MGMFKRCNLCGGPIFRIQRGPFGTRCIFCLSTFVHRAMGIVLDSMQLKDDITVYELSAHGALFKYLKKHFMNLTHSEYFDSIPAGTHHKGTICQNVQHLTFEDERFDLVTSTEVFEHVANDRLGFREVNRVLKNGGYFVFTVPLSLKEKTVERAIVENGQTKHLLPPTYGGDPLRKQGIIDFRNYGMDIVERLGKAGFPHVEIREVKNMKHMIPCKHVILAKK